MKTIRLNAASWNRFATRKLIITPDLVGFAHEFVCENCKVRISLPSAEYLPTEPLTGDLLSFWNYSEINGKKIPLRIGIHMVDVVVHIPEQISIPKEVLNSGPNAYAFVPENKQTELNNLAKTYVTIADAAFQLWVRTMRWKCNDGSICRPKVSDYDVGWATYLIDSSTNQRLWAWHSTRVIPVPEESVVVTPEIWASVDKALQMGSSPPIYIEQMFDGIEHLKLGYTHRALVDIAIACEIYLRVLFANCLPSGLGNTVREFLDEANVRPILTKFIPEFLGDDDKHRLKKIDSNLHKLFDARNKIVHTQQLIDITVDDCLKYIDNARKLFLIGRKE